MPDVRDDTETPVPLRILSYRRLDAAGEPTEIPASGEMLVEARRYARAWREKFGRFPQGQHPLKFPVNRQIRLEEADLILEFPVVRAGSG